MAIIKSFASGKMGIPYFGLDCLEPRLLLSGAPTAKPLVDPTFSASLQNGVLTVTGTNGNDIFAISDHDGVIDVVWGLQLTPTVGEQTFPVGQVQEIVVFGLGGNDAISISSAIFLPTSIVGGTGADQIQGGSGNDTIIGGSGPNVLNGGVGDDSITGGIGNDTIVGGPGNDTLVGGPGNDSLCAGAGFDFLIGGAGDDTLKGAAGNKLLYGGAGNDTFFGSVGRNTIEGAAGNDLIFTQAASVDVIFGGPGNDTAHSLGSDSFPDSDVEVILNT